MKIVSLPKGRQAGIRGGVVNVPITADKVCNSLPRTPNNAGIIALKLKRKLSYKGYVSYKNIRPNAVKDALSKLKTINEFYSHVEDNAEWKDQCSSEDADIWNTLVSNTEGPDQCQGQEMDPAQIDESAILEQE